MEAAIAASGLEVPVVLEDERYTTAQAERSLIRQGVRRKKRKKVKKMLQKKNLVN